MLEDRAESDGRLDAAMLTLALGIFAWLSIDSLGFVIDDAFITFRYARHWAEGLGPVWNAGEAVEGYTNFLWMAFATAFFALTDSTDAALAGIKAAGLALGAFTLVRVFTFPGPHGRARRPGAVLLASQPVFVANCGDGLETPLFAALAVECARAVAARPTAGSGALAGGLTGALCATRPEALPLVVALPALVVGCGPDRRRAAREFAGPFLLVAGALVAAHFAWRLSTYGAWLPNTYAAKATGSPALRLASGLEDVRGFFWHGRAGWAVSIWLGLALAGLATARGLARAGPSVLRLLGVLWGFILFRLAFDIWSGGEFMGVYRFLAPLLPFLCILADEGGRIVWRRGRVARVGLATVCAIALLFNLAGHRQVAEFRASYQQGLERAHVALGLWLRERYAPTDVVAVGDAGAISFYSELPVIDLWGLNTAEISRLPGEYGRRQGAATWALAQRPRAFVLWSRDSLARIEAEGIIQPGTHFGRELLASRAFHDAYLAVEEFTFRPADAPGTGYYLAVFERRDPLSRTGPGDRR